MKRLLVNGDPGIRADDVIELDGEQLVCFQVTRNGDWHGPRQVQLWCVVGTEAERDTFEQQAYTPHFLDTKRVDATAVTPLDSA